MGYKWGGGDHNIELKTKEIFPTTHSDNNYQRFLLFNRFQNFELSEKRSLASGLSKPRNESYSAKRLSIVELWLELTGGTLTGILRAVS